MATNPFDQKKGGTATKSRALAAANGDGEPASARKGDPFALPTSGGGGDYKFTDFVGELLLVRPIEVDTMVTKISPDSEFVRVDTVRLDNENERVDDLLVFGTALIRTFKTVLRGDSEWVLGRLELGEAKNGKNAPYILAQPTKDEIDLAYAVMTDMALI